MKLTKNDKYARQDSSPGLNVKNFFAVVELTSKDNVDQIHQEDNVARDTMVFILSKRQMPASISQT